MSDCQSAGSVVIAAATAAMVLFGSPCSQCAAEEPLVTDRPDFTESSSVVGTAVVQLESGVTEEVSLFFELIGFNREEARGPSTLTFQTGAVYLLNSDLQLDVRAARRLTDHGVDILLGAGISWRVGG